jgi:hypothetical protein
LSAIWRRDDDEWRPLLPSGFANEEALHDLVEEAPHLLPLSSDPSLVVLGREMALGSGYADLVAVEPDGRLSVIEIKLRRNAEARRAVLAQVLMYAASLKDADLQTLEREVRTSHIARRPFATLADAAREVDQTGAFDEDEFETAVNDCLSAGARARSGTRTHGSPSSAPSASRSGAREGRRSRPSPRQARLALRRLVAQVELASQLFEREGLTQSCVPIRARRRRARIACTTTPSCPKLTQRNLPPGAYERVDRPPEGSRPCRRSPGCLNRPPQAGPICSADCPLPVRARSGSEGSVESAFAMAPKTLSRRYGFGS